MHPKPAVGYTMEIRFQLAGWLVFLICSGLFIMQSILARDIWGLAASVTFLVGCLLFLLPYLVARED
jgi:hypothetical protein